MVAPLKMADRKGFRPEVTRDKTIEITKYATLHTTDGWKIQFSYYIISSESFSKENHRQDSIPIHLPLRRKCPDLVYILMGSRGSVVPCVTYKREIAGSIPG